VINIGEDLRADESRTLLGSGECRFIEHKLRTGRDYAISVTLPDGNV
jgi:hypothetical protein